MSDTNELGKAAHKYLEEYFRNLRQEVRLGWKVVKRYGLLSCMIRGSGTVSYRYREWVQPKKGCGPLCVFDHEGAAMRFCSVSKKVVPCFYVPSKQTAIWQLENTIWGSRDALLSELPEGTVLADAVYLIP